MVQSFLSGTALICCSVSLVVLTVGCNQDQQRTTTDGSQSSLSDRSLAAIGSRRQSPSLPTISASQSPEPTETELSVFEQALNRATGAKSISQSAVSVEDWNLVASQFQEAIALMRQVRRDSDNYAVAQRKIREYRRQVTLARQKAQGKTLASAQTKRSSVIINVPKPQMTEVVPPSRNLKTTTPSVSPPVTNSVNILPLNGEVFIAPIKRRVGGTPIIEVTFNGTQRFEMIVDTGASGTVITQRIATALGVRPVGKAKANTASAKAVEFAIGYLDSMEAGGMKVNRVPVAIAGTELDTGLLGHDFFGNYDVTIKRHVVEFRPQTYSEANPSGIQLTVPTLSRDYRFVKFL
ncbi:MAG: TIGR02281 family clan AA aspartic protease [Cuspidothrix sp.]